MVEKEPNIEKIFRDALEEMPVKPSPGTWLAIRRKLWIRQFLAFNPGSFNVYYLGGVAVLALTGYLMFSQPEKPDSRAVSSPPESTAFPGREPGISVPGKEQAVQPTDNIQPNGPERENLKKHKEENRIFSDADSLKKELPGVSGTGSEHPGKITSVIRRDEETIPSAEKELQKTILPEQKEREERFKPPLKADFKASQTSGCAPLAVEFVNLSQQFEQTEWTFGDGGSSSEPNPSYVYDEPGTYTAELRVYDTTSISRSVTMKILVHASPKVHFEFDETADISKGEPVYFYNYTRNADFYLWDFGDGTYSELIEPVHYYEEAGEYNIKLKAWNTNQCYDSLTVTNAFNPDLHEIIFPNAFTPNLNGPSNGFYRKGEVNNHVFHPVVKGDLTEYQLKIFNRRGVLLFESNDINIGWDGYYKEKLMPQGVYIWKARGRFSHGKTFVKSGDVTMLIPE